MLILTTTQAAAMSDGSVPEAVRGTIKKVWPRTETRKQPQYLKAGESDVGSLQKLIVTDGTTEIQVMVDGREAIPSNVAGSPILLTAFKGDRGFVGLKRKDNTYNNVTSPQLWVYRAGDIVVEGGGQQQQGSASAQPAAQRQNTATPPRQAPANQASNGHANGQRQAGNPPPPAPTSPPLSSARALAMKEYDRRLARSTAAYERCFDAAVGMAIRIDERHSATGGFKPDAHTIEKMAACLMVQSCWNQKPSEMEAFPIRHFSAYDADGKLVGKPTGSQLPQQQQQDDSPPFDA